MVLANPAIVVSTAVAIVTEYLKVCREVVLHDPLIETGADAVYFPLFRPVIVDVVDCQELWLRLSAAEAACPIVIDDELF